MAAPAQGEDSDDGMDEFMEKFKAQKYKNAFNESNWEEVRKNCHVIRKKNTGNCKSLMVDANRFLKINQCAVTLHLAEAAR